MFRLVVFLVSTLAGVGFGPVVAMAQDQASRIAPTTRFIDAPPGFESACAAYAWLCSAGSGIDVMLSEDALGELGAAVNKEVNREVEQATDSEIYGMAEKWALPRAGRGDCEDLALEKMRRLLNHGVPAERLGMAIVLDRRGNNHAVLLLHLDQGNLVLDSLTDRVLQPAETNYRMLAMQASEDRARWVLVDRMTTAHLSSTTAVRSVSAARSLRQRMEAARPDR